MNYFYSILLGIIQGLTEFLPVSSSGHLVIVQNLLPGFSEPGILFDVILHAGTLLAILYYFRKKLLSYLNIKFLLSLAVGTIPAVVIGFLFKDLIENLFSSVKLVGFALLLTGVFNFIVDKLKSKTEVVKLSDSLIIGLFQALAIVPGISRSGSTIFSGVLRGIDRKKAAEFSFILSIPAVLGANLLEVYNYTGNLNGNLKFYFVGFIAAFVSGVIAIRLVFNILANKSFVVFSYYCFVVGISVLLFL